MASSLFLAQFLGILFLVFGFVVLMRGRLMQEMVFRFALRPVFTFLGGAVGFAVGLFIVLVHFSFETLYQSIITIIGMWVILESIAYMLLPRGIIAYLLLSVNRPILYKLISFVTIIIGAYLSFVGFGLV